MKNIPQYRQKMDSFLSGEDYLVKWSVEKCYRNVFLFFQPWLLLGSWITLAISSDWVTDPTLNIMTVVFSVAYSAANILQSFITNPSMYSRLVSYAMIMLPNGCSPMEDPVMMYKRSEVLKQRKKPKESRRQLAQLPQEMNTYTWKPGYPAVYINESENGQNKLRSAAVSDQIRFLVLKWMVRTRTKDPQRDPAKATPYDTELRSLLDNLFNVIGSLRILRPRKMGFQDDDVKVLEDYNALFTYDPFQACWVSVVGVNGCTRSMKSLRTPINLLQSTLSKESTANNEHEQADLPKSKPMLRNEASRYWMLRKEERTLLQVKARTYVNCIYIITTLFGSDWLGHESQEVTQGTSFFEKKNFHHTHLRDFVFFDLNVGQIRLVGHVFSIIHIFEILITNLNVGQVAEDLCELHLHYYDSF
ncbi:unnamed protein product [Cylicocyclus nassatus]|uniref:Uncharacterized protein n=1 Tax=Cylicocyclus nassatus TaxID=53992 RepID=A0AA36GZF0_CYLNA|nr:unnamed protein product [Cylicocyclus nassatus]